MFIIFYFLQPLHHVVQLMLLAQSVHTVNVLSLYSTSKQEAYASLQESGTKKRTHSRMLASRGGEGNLDMSDVAILHPSPLIISTFLPFQHSYFILFMPSVVGPRILHAAKCNFTNTNLAVTKHNSVQTPRLFMCAHYFGSCELIK